MGTFATLSAVANACKTGLDALDPEMKTGVIEL
jgi:hypothetical protein